MALLAATTCSASTKAAAQPWPPAPAAGDATPCSGLRLNCRSKALATADRSASRVTGFVKYWIGPCGRWPAWFTRPGSARRTIPSSGWMVASRRTNSSPRPSASTAVTSTCTRSFSSSDKPSSSPPASDTREAILLQASGGKLPNGRLAVNDKDV